MQFRNMMKLTNNTRKGMNMRTGIVIFLWGISLLQSYFMNDFEGSTRTLQLCILIAIMLKD